MTACIFNIQRFSVNDGPGIRTTVFFKGCNLRCAWCHNPESLGSEPQLELNPDKCIGCGACVRVCPVGAHSFDEKGHHIDREKCILCGKCADTCYAESIVMAGKHQTVDEVFAEIMDDAPYYAHSGGGATFSGGECMLQYVFLHEVMKRCKENGISTAVDTAGNVPWKFFEAILPYADMFLYDLKAADPEKHRILTGRDNELIVDNLRKLSDSGARIIIRTPMIPGCNDSDDDIAGLCDIIKDIKAEAVEVLPYHRLGEGKYKSLDMPYRLEGTPVPSKGDIAHYLEVFKENGVDARQN